MEQTIYLLDIANTAMMYVNVDVSRCKCHREDKCIQNKQRVSSR